MLRNPKYDRETRSFIYDYNTTNGSFIYMANLLRKKGIKNYSFFLKLYDQDLVGVDPYDPNLTEEYMFKILMECRKNFWYFIREVVRIPGAKGNGRFGLHRGNLAASWCFLHNIPTYLVLPRQHGKTIMAIVYALWIFNFASEYTNMLFMNKQLLDSQRNLKSLRDIREMLPAYLRMDKMLTDNGSLRDATNNVGKVANALHNQIDVRASAHNPISADALGRGMTVAWVWIDELAFLQYNQIIYEAMIPAWSRAAENAIANGRPIGRILTTTPSDLSTEMGKFAYQLRSDAAWFDEHMYDQEDCIDEILKKTSKNGYMYIEFQYYQLGDDDDWFDDQCKQLNYNWAKIRREVLIQWANAASNSPFKEDDLRDLHAMLKTESDNDSIVINKFYKLNVYRKLETGRKYLITCDVGKGRGEKADRTAITVIDAATDECCAIFKSPVIQYKDTYRFIHTLFYKYVPNSVIIVENNIDTVLEYLKASTMRQAVYYEPTKKVIEENRKNGHPVNSDSQRIVYGLNTNTDTRQKYFEILFDLVEHEKDKICARELVEEIETLEYRTESRIEAVSGQHDDVVLSYLFGIYVKRFGRNRARFGIQYIDDLGTQLTKTDPEVYKAIDALSKSKDELLTEDNPFFKEMKDMSEKSFDELDKEWRDSSLSNDRDSRLNYESTAFTGKKNELGMEVLSSDDFDRMNGHGLDSEDFNKRDPGDLDFMRDTKDDGWF